MLHEEIVELLSEGYADQAIRFVGRNEYILNYHLVHFFTKKVWKELPKEWQEYFSCRSERSNALPASLHNFFTLSEHLSVKREVSQQTKDRALNIPDALCQMKGMNQKKIHEVSAMGGAVHSLCNYLHINQVVDVGAGSAYLSHSLYMNCNIHSLGIEGNPSHTQGALQRFEQLRKRVKTHNTRQKNKEEETQIPEPSIDLVTFRFECNSNEIYNDFETFVRPYCTQLPPQVVMIGLHCCGDLTSSMLRIYSKSEIVRGIVVVSCCYNHLTVPTSPQELEGVYGFPMSKHFAESMTKNHFTISQLMLEVSVSCYGRWICRDDDTISINRKSLAYRAILEEILHELIPADTSIVIRGQSLPHSAYSSFEKYTRLIEPKIFLKRDNTIEKLPFSLQNYTKELQNGYEKRKEQFLEIEAFQELKLNLQPVIESMILLDRCAFLIENGFHVDLVPLFDQVVSPRNMGIISYK